MNNLADRGLQFFFLLAAFAFILELEGHISPKMLIILFSFTRIIVLGRLDNYIYLTYILSCFTRIIVLGRLDNYIYI